MRQWWVAASLFFAAILAGCGGSARGEAVRVDWQAKDGAILETALDAHVIPTTVYVTNPTEQSLQNVQIRLPLDDGALGVSLGTTASAHTYFEPGALVWRVGDLPPRTQLTFDLGLWFESKIRHEGGMTIDLQLQVTSPDIRQALTSNKLAVLATSK